MDLLSITTSKITYLTNVRRSRGQLFLPLAARKLAERYLFQGMPTSLQDMEQTPITFRHGLFQDSAIDEFNIYNDGIVVSAASNSSTLAAFIADLFSWMTGDLGLSEVEQLRRGKIYESALVVQMEIDAAKVAPWARATERMLSAKWESYGHPRFDFQFGSLRLAPDPGDRTFVPVPFTLERRAGVPFEENVFFTTAPLTTDDHLEVVQQIEKSLR